MSVQNEQKRSNKLCLRSHMVGNCLLKLFLKKIDEIQLFYNLPAINVIQLQRAGLKSLTGRF